MQVRNLSEVLDLHYILIYTNHYNEEAILMDKNILQDFTDWINAQPTPKSKRDKDEYIKRATNGNYSPLDKFRRIYRTSTTLPEASLTDLYDASVTENDLSPKEKSIVSKCLAYKIDREEESSPSALVTGKGLSIYSLISAIHRARKNQAENGYNHILSALMLVPLNVFPYDGTDDHIRPEKSNKYKLYRHVMLFNLTNKNADVTKNLTEAFSLLFSEKGEEKESCNMIFPLKSVGQNLLSDYENMEGFKGSAAHYLLMQLSGAATYAENYFSSNETGNYYASLIARLSLIALNNQGMGFAGNRLPHCTNEDDKILFALLSPFSESLTVKLVGDAKLMSNKYVKRLLYQGLLYPATLKGSKHPRLVTAGGYESGLPDNKDGIKLLSKIKNYPEMEKILHALLSEIYRAQKNELEMLFEDRIYKIDRGLFTFPKELVTLLAASDEREDVTDTKNKRFDTLLTSILSVSHWVNLRLFLLPPLSRFESGKRLSALISCRPVTASRAIGSLPDFYDKLSEAKDEHLVLNKKKENLLLAKTKLASSTDALDVVKSALAAENADFANYYITSALNFAKDAKRISLSFKDGLTAAFASAVCAESYAYLSLIKCRTDSAAMLIADCIIPAAKNLSEAESLIEDSGVFDEAILSHIRKNHFDTVSFVNETFYSDSSPVYKVLSGDPDVRIPFTLSYKTLKECAEQNHLDEIPENIKTAPALWIPHIGEHNGFFRPFYITDFDSELTARKNLTADEIQPLLMKTVLSGNTVRLTANQIADNTEILKLCDSHGFLSLLRKGFISLSLYGNVKSLADYVSRSLSNPKFIFSSIPELNYYGEKFECKKALEIMKIRELVKDFILGKAGEDTLPSSLRVKISKFKERILRFDENFPTASKYYNFQHPSGSALTLPEQFTAFFAMRKNLSDFTAPYKIHETILKYLPEDYNRSHYKNFIDKIKTENYIGIPISDRDKAYLCSFSDAHPTHTTDLMTDILTECHNTVLGSRVSPNIHYTYRGSDKLIPGNEYTTSFSCESETAYHDILTVEETGETVDFDSMFSYLSHLEAKIRENGEGYAKDKLAYSLDTPSLSYSVSSKGDLLLDKASFLTTESKSISVTNAPVSSDESVLHVEKGKKVSK